MLIYFSFLFFLSRSYHLWTVSASAEGLAVRGFILKLLCCVCRQDTIMTVDLLEELIQLAGNSS